MQTMMEPAEISKYTQVKVVDEQLLEAHTSSGWRLLAVLSESNEDRITSSQQAHFSFPRIDSFGNSSGTVPGYINLPTVERRASARFLVGLDRESALNGMAVTIDALRKALIAHEVARGEEGKRCKETAATIAKLEDEVESAQGRSIGHQHEATRLTALVRKMEADIAKIGKDIGDSRMRTILAGDPTP